MALNSSDVSAGDDILASGHNDLREDVREQNCDIQTRYYSFGAGQMVPTSHILQWNVEISGRSLDAANGAVGGTYVIPINLPHGAIVTNFKVVWFRDDALAAGTINLYRVDFALGSTTMADASSDAATGVHTVNDATIASPTIDNNNYTYNVGIILNPNDAVTDVLFYGGTITYTIVVGLP